MKLLFSSMLSAVVLMSTAEAQSNCKVSVDALTGTYTGDCSDGKAHGTGKAVGLDSYEGQFKNGFPEGTGTYTWADKSTYTGTFKKGLMDGKGELRYMRPGSTDSLLTGFWKKNKYLGAYEKVYVINDRSSKINRAEVLIVRKGEKTGSINISSTQMSSVSNYNANAIIPSVVDIQVITGQYISKTISNISKTGVVRIQQIIFPFRARFMYNNGEVIDITFNEQADYDVNISML
ncbi:MAG: hypothetical protein EOO06_10575 [Chitinophagaceae bacterium]|nr:MAG: hypothetical protein EOO06_10575 [Chitinophagaceae bacterium]